MNLKDAILGSNDLISQPLDIPEWNCQVHLRKWSGKQRAAFQSWYDKNKNDLTSMSALVAVMSVADENGHIIFTNDDVDKLNEKSATALDRIALAALKLNGISDDAIEDAKKNL